MLLKEKREAHLSLENESKMRELFKDSETLLIWNNNFFNAILNFYLVNTKKAIIQEKVEKLREIRLTKRKLIDSRRRDCKGARLIIC